VKIYRIDWNDEDHGSVVAWSTSRRDADATLRQMGRLGQGTGKIQLVEFPTTRAEVIDWLNTHLTTDNG
jgi:hypothetical protein